MTVLSAESQLEVIYAAARHVGSCWQKADLVLQVTHACWADCSPVQDGCFSFAVACIHATSGYTQIMHIPQCTMWLHACENSTNMYAQLQAA